MNIRDANDNFIYGIYEIYDMDAAPDQEKDGFVLPTAYHSHPPKKIITEDEPWGRYFGSAKDFAIIPKDPYAHASQLISVDTRSPREFREMISKHVLLGNVNSDRMMRLYQNDIAFLTLFFSLGQKDNSIKEFSELLFGAWVFEVAFTRTKNGLERWLQNFTGSYPSFKPEGFGKGIFKKKPKGPLGPYSELFEGDQPVYY